MRFIVEPAQYRVGLDRVGYGRSEARRTETATELPACIYIK